MVNSLQKAGLSGAIAPIREDQAQLLAPWIALYLEAQGGPKEGHTFRAKHNDLKTWVRYLADQFHDLAADISADELAGVPVKLNHWTKSHTEGFLKYLIKDRRQRQVLRKGSEGG